MVKMKSNAQNLLMWNTTSHCSVFGHTLSKCTERPREVGDENGNRGDKVRNNNDKEGFVEVVEKGAKSITRNN